MIQSICIEFRRKDGEWLLYKYITVSPDDGGTSEIVLLRGAFGMFYEFRAVVFTTEKIVVKEYDREKLDWVIKGE